MATMIATRFAAVTEIRASPLQLLMLPNQYSQADRSAEGALPKRVCMGPVAAGESWSSEPSPA